MHSAHICTPSFFAFKPLVDHFLLAIKKKSNFYCCTMSSYWSGASTASNFQVIAILDKLKEEESGTSQNIEQLDSSANKDESGQLNSSEMKMKMMKMMMMMLMMMMTIGTMKTVTDVSFMWNSCLTEHQYCVFVMEMERPCSVGRYVLFNLCQKALR
jgi:hypothetical protein